MGTPSQGHDTTASRPESCLVPEYNTPPPPLLLPVDEGWKAGRQGRVKEHLELLLEGWRGRPDGPVAARSLRPLSSVRLVRLRDTQCKLWPYCLTAQHDVAEQRLVVPCRVLPGLFFNNTELAKKISSHREVAEDNTAHHATLVRKSGASTEPFQIQKSQSGSKGFHFLQKTCLSSRNFYQTTREFPTRLRAHGGFPP